MGAVEGAPIKRVENERRHSWSCRSADSAYTRAPMTSRSAQAAPREYTGITSSGPCPQNPEDGNGGG